MHVSQEDLGPALVDVVLRQGDLLFIPLTLTLTLTLILTLTLTLTGQGDLLYIPRGFPHVTETETGTPSVHLTFTAQTQVDARVYM